MEIILKPHHFMDIIKLYGGGIETFVPDETMKHDFYKIANRMIAKHDTIIHLTVGSDDICRPCIKCIFNQCSDALDNIPAFDAKETYNKALDTRIIEAMNLDTNRLYLAEELCSIMLEHHLNIDMIWQEEENAITKKRHALFVTGANKYLNR